MDRSAALCHAERGLCVGLALPASQISSFSWKPKWTELSTSTMLEGLY